MLAYVDGVRFVVVLHSKTIEVVSSSAYLASDPCELRKMLCGYVLVSAL